MVINGPKANKKIAGGIVVLQVFIIVGIPSHPFSSGTKYTKTQQLLTHDAQFPLKD